MIIVFTYQVNAFACIKRFPIIEVAFLGESVCVADFNPYCAVVIQEKWSMPMIEGIRNAVNWYADLP